MRQPFSDSAVAPATLVDLLRRRAHTQPHLPAYTFLLDGTGAESRLTYAEFERQARAIGALLQQAGAAGERVLLLYPPGLAYLAAFFGCLYAGAAAVPAYPPNPARLDRTLPRLRAIAEDARPIVGLTTTEILPLVGALAAQDPAFQSMRWLAADALPDDLAASWQPTTLDPNSLAFLQYTSGSTAAPKGVMLTHANLLHNSALIYQAFGHSAASRGVIWLPPYHDMGLIGGIIQPLYGGFPVTLMSPVAFLQRPLSWLEAISRERATTSGGPNFAYDLCVRKITAEQRATLDLSSWTVAFNGAEPVRPETLKRFAAAFAPAGFRREAFYPCYGLAESTLIVAGGAAGAAPLVRGFDAAALERHQALAAPEAQVDRRALVGCGQALAGQQIAIVDPSSQERCSSGQIGEIWVAGPSVAQGYWDQPDATAATFGAYIAGDGNSPFLRTGDLGFIEDGELFITGRLKDLIIIRGRNHYPQDIELTVERSHRALRPGCGAAFALEVGGEERLVVAQELERQHRDVDIAEVAAAIRQAVAAAHELHVYEVALLKPGGIPKTSSGKIQRHACKASVLAGELELIGSSQLEEQAANWDAADVTRDELLASPSDERQTLLERYLQAQVARALRVAPVSVALARPINAFGLDSLMAVELQHAVESDLGVAVPMASFLQDQSIARLAADILGRLTEPASAADLMLARSPAPAAEHPLSAGQRALWFLQQLAPQSAAYNLMSAARIRGELDVAALERAFQRLADRHAALRTTFAAPDGEPVQQIHQQAAIGFEAQDATDLAVAQLDERLVQLAHRPFDLERGPLLRVHLFRRAAAEHVLLLVIHHSIADLWSLAVLTSELNALYSAEQTGRPAALAPISLHYADYVRWQAQMLAGPDGERLYAYWHGQLAGAPLVLDLPADRMRPAVQTYRGAAHPFRLDAALAGRLNALAQEAGATLYMTLLAAFQVLLHRVTGQDDLLVGSPTAGRSRAEFAGLVGYFVNLVVLRASLAGNPTFAALLAQVRQTVLAAFAHQEYPFALLVERLQPERDQSRSPIFQVVFALQKAPVLEGPALPAFALGESGAQMQLGDLTVESLALEQRIAQFDLSLLMAETADGLAGTLQYNADLFDAATIGRMGGHFETLLAAIAIDPALPVSALPLLSQVERRQLLVEWNDSLTEYPRESCFHELFEAQAARHPNATAVVCEGQQISYGELNRRANQLAHHLRSLGVGPDSLVAICMERSLEVIVGIVGIHKAGGAYVPLDPSYPAERLRYMLEDSRAAVVLTSGEIGDWRLEIAGGAQSPISNLQSQIVRLDTDWPIIARQPLTNPERVVLGEHLAYIIYTSGSTGRPKGVMVQQRGLLNLCYGLRAFFDDPSVTTTALITSFSFDISVNQIFPTLLFGRTLHVIPDALKYDSRAFVRYLTEQRIDLFDAVPSYLNAVLTEISPERVANQLRFILVGGEKLERRLLAKVFEQLGGAVQIVNIYGLTEITDINSLAVIGSQDLERTVTIGRPLQNNRIYITNRDGSLQPIGVTGEVCVSGESVSRGYLNRPELTAEKFVVCPFEDGALMVRTGDVGRRLPDGTIELLGRMDHQIKLRGFRIEIGEIEALLDSHPDVRENVVIVREDVPGDARLVAYVVPGDWRIEIGDSDADNLQSPISNLSQTLRAFLKQKLPDYMVPAAFVLLEALPHTPNGKIDRKALPAPDQALLRRDRAVVAPRSPLEVQLAAIWSQVLGVEQIGIDDNFFELGGHSLFATQVITRVRSTLQVELPLQKIFEEPTIAGMARLIEAAPKRAPAAGMGGMTRLPRGEKSLEQLLADLERLSTEDARALLGAAETQGGQDQR